jgi:ABC-type Fe3+ transport system substrate-binding protein
MKNFLVRILLAAAVTLVAFALSSSAQAQQADEDRAPATPRQSQSPATPQASQPSADAQTQDVLAFTGRVMKDQGQLVLKDPVTKMSYQLDDQAKAKPYLGKQVKVKGKLEMKSNTIHIEDIAPLS